MPLHSLFFLWFRLKMRTRRQSAAYWTWMRKFELFASGLDGEKRNKLAPVSVSLAQMAGCCYFFIDTLM